MVKMPDGAGCLQTEVRKTRGGHVLIEISGQGTTSEVAEGLNPAIGQEVENIPLLNRIKIEVKSNLFPLGRTRSVTSVGILTYRISKWWILKP